MRHREVLLHVLSSTAYVTLPVLTLWWRDGVRRSNLWSDGTEA